MMAWKQRIAVISVLAVGLLAVSVAEADLSKAVQKKFRGKILVTTDILPTFEESDAETIKAYNKLNQSVVKSFNQDGLATWSFHFMAFMKKKPKTTQLSLDFYTTDKEKLFVADKRLAGVDPTLTLLSSRVEINEDDGLNKGRTYTVKLTGKVGKREVTFATTKLTMK